MARKAELGDVLKDRHTGYSGTVMGITEYLYGCRRIGLQAFDLQNGSPAKWEWFDEPRLEGIDGITKPGGPRPDAPSR